MTHDEQQAEASGESLQLPVPGDAKARFALGVVRRLRQHGFRAVWAGGCVRDLLMGLKPVDYDVATDARPEQVRRLFRRTVPVGAQFGVVLVVGKGEEGEVQVATFRREGPYSDGRHPDQIVYCSMLEDARRRDFTINGMFYDPDAEVLYDFVGGRRDIERKLIRAIGTAEERFAEDKLRLIRAVRFAARFGFALEPATRDAVRRMAPQIRQVSAERIWRELQLLLVHRSRAEGLRLMAELGLLEAVLPDVAQLRGRAGAGLHAGCVDMWEHTVRTTAALEAAWAEARALVERRIALQSTGVSLPLPTEVPVSVPMAAVLHGVAEGEPQGVTYEQLLRRKRQSPLRRICARLRTSNDLRLEVEWLVLNAPVLLEIRAHAAHEWKPLLADPRAPLLLAWARAEAGELGDEFLRQWRQAAECYVQLSDEALNPPPLLTGEELIRLGVPRGPRVGELLRRLRAEQLDDRVRTAEEARAFVCRQLGRRAEET